MTESDICLQQEAATLLIFKIIFTGTVFTPEMQILDILDTAVDAAAGIAAAVSGLDLPAGIHLRLLRLTMDAETMNSRALQNGRLELA